MKTGTKIFFGVATLGLLVGGYFLLKRRQLPSPVKGPVKNPLAPEPSMPDLRQWMATPVTTKEAQAVLSGGATVVRRYDLPIGVKNILGNEVGPLNETKPTVHKVMVPTPIQTSGEVELYVADFSRYSKTANWIIVEQVFQIM
jgi:hypothetical protein